jgi:hypothetical protein
MSALQRQLDESKRMEQALKQELDNAMNEMEKQKERSAKDLRGLSETISSITVGSVFLYHVLSVIL